MASTLPNTYFQLSSTDEVGNDSVHSMLQSSTTVSIADPNKKKLGLASFVILTVYAVNGGPFGTEDIVRAGGPFYALVGFFLILVWALPEALITAELSSTFPESSGSVAWVESAFGPFWAFQKDNALYPILFYDCLSQLIGDLWRDPSVPTSTAYYAKNIRQLDYRSFGVKGLPYNNSNSFISSNNTIYAYSNQSADAMEASGLVATTDYRRMLFILSLTAVLTYLSYKGLDVVANVAIVLYIVTLVPFVILCVLGIPKIVPSRWLVGPPEGPRGVDWRLLLNTFFWNINYWDCAATFAADVDNPGRTYPVGMCIAVLLVTLSCLLPILVGTGVSEEPYSVWQDGYFIHLAGLVGGRWLAWLMMLAAAFTNVGMFVADMSSQAWEIAGMAERSYLPSVLAERNSCGVPKYGVVMSAVVVVLLGTQRFTQVIEMLNILYCFGQIIEFCAFLHLRRIKPDLERPYQIGLGLVGMSVVLSGPIIFIGIILSYSDLPSLATATGVALLGGPVYLLLVMARERRWCAFFDS